MTYDGILFTKYVIGPGGLKMTRAYPMQTLEGETHDHPHHRSIWFGHQGTDGFDSWHERQTMVERSKKRGEEDLRNRLASLASTVHRRFISVKAARDSATIISENDYVGSDGRKLLSDLRTIVFRAGKSARTIDFDIKLIASYGDSTLTDKKDAGFSLRIPTSMDVDRDKGGTILNSNGLKDKAAWGKRAAWVAYSGPVKGETMSIIMLNHPASFRHPTPWHVRTYGLLTANPFGLKSLDKSAKDGSILLRKGESLTLRHRVILRKGRARASTIEADFAAYSSE